MRTFRWGLPALVIAAFWPAVTLFGQKSDLVAQFADPVLSAEPSAVANWRMDYATGVLWRFTGSATPLSYTLLPQILSMVSPRIGTTRAFAGGYLVLRNRFSLLVEPIIKGPEHHYVGGSASGLLEWWDPSFRRCGFFSSGGGVGWLDSKGQTISGGQGENFNFNWFVYTGGRLKLSNNRTAGLGIYFQHISNTGFNIINPGLNALGPEVDFGWRF